MAADDEMPPDPTSLVADAVAASMQALENAAIFDLTAAYKARMMAVGFPEEAAIAMAVDYHRTLVQ